MLKSGSVYVPKTPEPYTHDVDGNQTSDGRWTYTWDAENRLVTMEAIAAVPANAKQRLEFAYDAASRRIQKLVYNWSSGTSSYQLLSSTRFVYDKWNLVAEIDGSGSVFRSYVWGQDLSGTLEGGGGTGGTLLINSTGNSYAPGYDGNGNVTVLVKVGGGIAAASYEYGPFGELLAETGEYAVQNALRFSKLVDAETSLAYYGFRSYGPFSGRWLNRDPLEEEGGTNLYGFSKNDPVGLFDKLGLAIVNLKYHVYIETPKITFGFPARTFNGGTKVRHSVNVDTESESLSQVEKFIGGTIEYDPAGKVIGTGHASGSSVRAFIDARGPTRGQGEGYFRVKMVGDEGNPLYSGAPAISWELYVSFYKCSRKLEWKGMHDGFPSHDLDVKGNRVHHFSHVKANTSPMRLFFMDQSFGGKDTF